MYTFLYSGFFLISYNCHFYNTKRERTISNELLMGHGTLIATWPQHQCWELLAINNTSHSCFSSFCGRWMLLEDCKSVTWSLSGPWLMDADENIGAKKMWLKSEHLWLGEHWIRSLVWIPFRVCQDSFGPDLVERMIVKTTNFVGLL